VVRVNRVPLTVKIGKKGEWEEPGKAVKIPPPPKMRNANARGLQGEKSTHWGRGRRMGMMGILEGKGNILWIKLIKDY